MAFILADQLGSIENVSAELEDNELIILPKDLEKFGILNLRKFGKGSKGKVGVDDIVGVGRLFGDEAETFLFEKVPYIGAPVALVFGEHIFKFKILSYFSRFTGTSSRNFSPSENHMARYF